MRRRPLAFRVLASLVVLLLVAAGAEVAARAVGPVVPAWQPQTGVGVIMTGHPTRLWGMAPGVRQNFKVSATINELGLRGPAPGKRTGERILLVGDSSFFGHGIADDATIAVVLENDLRERGIDVDVVNAAIPGYSTEQTRLLLDEVGWSFEPTLLLSGNLWSDNNADGFRDADLLRTAAAFYGNPLAESAFYRLLVGWIDRARGGSGARVVTWTRDEAWPDKGQRRVPIQDYAANLDTMVREARERGAGAAFIAPTNRILVDGTLHGGAGWDPYFRVQREVAAWHGAPVVSAYDALQADPAPASDKLIDEMHPSERGAADIGHAVARTLVDAGWPTNRLLGRAEPFDTSGVVDDAPVAPGTQTRNLSPQAQLFPAPGATGTVSAPPPVAPSGPGEGRVSGWDVTGRVLGSGPMLVTFQGKDGRSLGFVRLADGGPFTFHVRPGEATVTLLVTAEDGRRATATATEGGGAVTVAGM